MGPEGYFYHMELSNIRVIYCNIVFGEVQADIGRTVYFLRMGV